MRKNLNDQIHDFKEKLEKQAGSNAYYKGLSLCLNSLIEKLGSNNLRFREAPLLFEEFNALVFVAIAIEKLNDINLACRGDFETFLNKLSSLSSKDQVDPESYRQAIDWGCYLMREKNRYLVELQPKNFLTWENLTFLNIYDDKVTWPEMLRSHYYNDRTEKEAPIIEQSQLVESEKNYSTVSFVTIFMPPVFFLTTGAKVIGDAFKDLRDKPTFTNGLAFVGITFGCLVLSFLPVICPIANHFIGKDRVKKAEAKLQALQEERKQQQPNDHMVYKIMGRTDYDAHKAFRKLYKLKHGAATTKAYPAEGRSKPKKLVGESKGQVRLYMDREQNQRFDNWEKLRKSQAEDQSESKKDDTFLQELSASKHKSRDIVHMVFPYKKK